MSDSAVRDLVHALSLPTTESLVLVPAERQASLHVYVTDDGWTATLDCRRMMSDRIRGLVATDRRSRCDVVWQGHNVDRVTVHTGSPSVVRRLLDSVISDHRRTAPGSRLAALVLGEDGCSPLRVEVVRPSAPRPPLDARPPLAMVRNLSHA